MYAFEITCIGKCLKASAHGKTRHMSCNWNTFDMGWGSVCVRFSSYKAWDTAIWPIVFPTQLLLLVQISIFFPFLSCCRDSHKPSYDLFWLFFFSISLVTFLWFLSGNAWRCKETHKLFLLSVLLSFLIRPQRAYVVDWVSAIPVIDTWNEYRWLIKDNSNGHTTHASSLQCT